MVKIKNDVINLLRKEQNSMNIGIDIDDTMSNSFEIMLADSQIYDIEEMKGTGDIKNLGSIPTYDQIENMYKWEEEALKNFGINTLKEF